MAHTGGFRKTKMNRIPSGNFENTANAEARKLALFAKSYAATNALKMHMQYKRKGSHNPGSHRGY